MEMISTLVRTELGSMPDDWRIATAADICECVVDCKNRTPPVVAHGDYAVVRTPNVRNGRFVRDDLRFTDERSFKEWTARATPQVGDVLITREAPLGEVCPVPQDLQVCLGQRMMLYRPDESKVTGAYLVYALMSSAVQKGLQKKIGGSTVGHAKVDDIRFIQLPLPPTTSEQRAIAEALEDADALIDSLEQLLTKKRQIKQGAMQELLTGKRRLPGFTGEWVTRELRQLGHVVRGVAYNPDADLADGDTEQTVRLLRSNNVQGGEIVRIGLQFVNCRRVRGDQYLRDGDLLLCMANGSRDLVGKAGRFVRTDEHQYTFGAFMSCFRPDPQSVASEFVAFLFQTHAFRQHVDLLLAGSSINNLRPEGVLGFAASIPTEPSEQIALAQALTDMDTELSTLESRLTKARALKQAMAQALLTGRIRLAEGVAA